MQSGQKPCVNLSSQCRRSRGMYVKEDIKHKPSADHSKQRRPYIKPEVRRVLLRPEEAVLASCKVQGGSGGPTGSHCRQGQTPCLSYGS